ncbi:MAG: VOC family protein [Cyclobacteriaceae bacterium]
MQAEKIIGAVFSAIAIITLGIFIARTEFSFQLQAWFEHFAINVPEPKAIADWYVEHVGLTIVRQQAEDPFMTFLADESGRVLCELNHRSEQAMMNFGSQHALTFHFAMESTNAEADKARLIEAGATLF